MAKKIRGRGIRVSERKDSSKLELINPNNIKFDDSDILVCDLLLDGVSMDKTIIFSKCRGVDDVKMKVDSFGYKGYSKISLSIFMVNGKCAI